MSPSNEPPRTMLTVVDSACQHLVPEHHSLRTGRREQRSPSVRATPNTTSVLGVDCSSAVSAAGVVSIDEIAEHGNPDAAGDGRGVLRR